MGRKFSKLTWPSVMPATDLAPNEVEEEELVPDRVCPEPVNAEDAPDECCLTSEVSRLGSAP